MSSLKNIINYHFRQQVPSSFKIILQFVFHTANC